MIVTLTPNPSLDRTVEVTELVRGQVIRATGGRVDPGGKGVNVSRALAANGIATTAVLPSGGPEGLQLTRLLAPQGVAVTVVPIEGQVRTNISVVEPDGTTTKLNEPGPRLTEVEVTALVAAALHVASADGWVVGCGSLPLGVDDDFYARLVEPVRARGARVAVDSSRAALRRAADAKPDLLKPNREELAEVIGRRLDTLGDVVAAAEELRSRGVGTVLASLGRDGAVLVDASGAVHGEAVVERPRSTVGAGDAMLAGYLAHPSGGRAALALALAWGAAAAGLPGSRMPAPADVAAITVTLHDRIDPRRPLEGDLR